MEYFRESQQDQGLESEMELEKVEIEVIIEAQRVENERIEREKRRKEELLRLKGLPIIREDLDDKFLN